MKTAFQKMVTNTIILTLMIVLSNVGIATTQATTRTIFIVQPDRGKQILEQDAQLIFEHIQAAQQGDSVHAFSTSSEPIITLDLPENQNKVQQRQTKQIAINQLRTYFLKVIQHPPTEGSLVDVAGAIRQAMDRFNTRPYNQMILVLLTNGLQIDRTSSWRSAYPSDSWILHSSSPFSSIRPNTTNVPIQVLMLPAQAGYLDTYHADRMSRFYTLFFHHKKAKLCAFTFDHQTIKTLLRNGISGDGLPVPSDAKLDGDLFIHVPTDQ